ncbi:MAG TPA: hypothetical protein VJA19_22585 [Pseudomonas sp.]|nr:hypothetical protein [Pseudomonas sp.]
MSEQATQRLTFIDAAAFEGGDVELYLGCEFTDAPPGKSRMLLLRKDGKWGHHDVNSSIRSVDISDSPFGFFALCKDGVVSLGDSSQISFEFIEDAGTGAGKFGYVKRIRNIAGELYVCGDLHQVYRRAGGSWPHIDRDLLIQNPRAIGVSLNDMDGTDSNDIYSVGDRGVICHFDGTRWEKLDSPTNCNLERVLCLSADSVYVCGNNGVLLHGNRNGWQALNQDNAIGDTLWGIAEFQGEVYLSTNLQLYKLRGEVAEPVSSGIAVAGSNSRLTASSSKLWSISANDILVFDGLTWSQVVYPANT